MHTPAEIQVLDLSQEKINQDLSSSPETNDGSSEISSISNSSYEHTPTQAQIVFDQLSLDLRFFEDNPFFETLTVEEVEKMRSMPINNNFFEQAFPKDFTHPEQNQHQEDSEEESCCGILSQYFLSIKKGT